MFNDAVSADLFVFFHTLPTQILYVNHKLRTDPVARVRKIPIPVISLVQTPHGMMRYQLVHGFFIAHTNIAVVQGRAGRAAGLPFSVRYCCRTGIQQFHHSFVTVGRSAFFYLFKVGSLAVANPLL